MTQTKARASQRQRQVQYLSFTHNDIIRASDVRFKVDARERDEIGEIIMQVKYNQKIIYRSLYKWLYHYCCCGLSKNREQSTDISLA